MVRCLLDNGAAVNDGGGAHCGGQTPLIDAATNGHLDVVKLLVERGAEIRARDAQVGWQGKLRADGSIEDCLLKGEGHLGKVDTEIVEVSICMLFL